ncbi:hypothetical protein M408DRAFT_75205 [Serendipita vermifera MAFF 305830]|uniref:Protein kinase domain-containing protein n=1 Tax=Serendipita vermifera MAFF 305830 TaxID=933852 RepID=A0A0C3AJX8_SERVB|nr:hypothetical protein M408DRAFT_75205 [Serendipita vermifera MAFF 305830]
MHQQLVAHLDLKPDNLVIADAQTGPRILIIDFGTSVRVISRDDLITGYRGTAGWVAPEVGWRETPDQSFSPISADLWACGKLLQWLCSHLQDSYSPEFTRLATDLMDSEPQNRPVLTLPLQLQSVSRGVKRKLETLDDERNQRLRPFS